MSDSRAIRCAVSSEESGERDGAAGELRRFGQRRFYDCKVWSAGKKSEKLDYVHAKLVNRGLVKHPKDWPWSSFLFYARDLQGLVPIDPVD